MKKLVLGIGIFLLSSISTFAAPVAPANLKADSQTENSITVSWDAVSNVLGYYLYYDVDTTEPRENFGFEIVDLIETTSYTIEGLETGTLYNIAVTAIDSDGEESTYSQDIVSGTLTEGQAKDFAIEKVEATAIDTLEFTFSAPLETGSGAVREFLVEHSETKDELLILETELDEENSRLVIVTLENQLTLGGEYDVTVLSIQDETGRNIENGIDAVTNFTVPSEFAEPTVEEPIEDIPEDTTPIEEPEEELQSAGPEDTTPVEELKDETSGTIISNSEIEKNTEVAASKNEELPQTGPEHIILLLVALLLGGTVFFLQYRSHNS